MSRPMSVLLFHEDPPTCAALQGRLAAEGLAVTCAHTLLEAAPHLADTDVLLFYMPATAWAGYAALGEIRRASPSLRIIAMVGMATDEFSHRLGRLGISTILWTRTKWTQVVHDIRVAGVVAAGDTSHVASRP